MPYTIDGDFRASAVDKGPVREKDPNGKNAGSLRKDDVAQRCVLAVDRAESTVFMPIHMRVAHALYWIIPSFVEWRARKKYNFGV